MYSSKPRSFLHPFSLRRVVLGISCHVLFVLISKAWRPLFAFLHLYFGSCSRDVGIYFPALCASIVHDVCIYTCSPLPVWLSQSMSSKAKWCLISAAKVRWHVIKFSRRKSGICLNALGKHRLGPHTFKSQTWKLPMHVKPQKPISNSCFLLPVFEY